jgi:hypothetical protein
VRIPCATKQGIILAQQGILAREQGILSAGIGTITGSDFSIMSAVIPKDGVIGLAFFVDS